MLLKWRNNRHYLVATPMNPSIWSHVFQFDATDAHHIILMDILKRLQNFMWYKQVNP